MLTDQRENFRPFDYEWAAVFTKMQADHPWTADQIGVESDVTQYKTSFTASEQHGTQTTSKLFTIYETKVANFWIDVIYHNFPQPEIRIMACEFAAQEGQHGLFYDKVNTALGFGTKEFYLSFLEEPEMVERMKFIEDSLAMGRSGIPKGLAESIATFTFIEGVVLYSSFAFLLSFQRPPKNKFKATSTGLAYSVRDENIHAEAGSRLFNEYIKEQNIDLVILEPKIIQIAQKAFEHEEAIINNIFAKGPIEGITAHQMKEFVKSRVNIKLKDIGIKPIYEVTYNPIANWFYKMINNVEMTDFFDRSPTAYTHDWDFESLKGWY